MLWTWKKFAGIASIILTVAALIGVGAAIDSRYARAERVVEVSDRLSMKIIQDRINAITEQMWKMEDRWQERYHKEHEEYATHDELLAYMSEDARDTYRQLEEELEYLREELKKYIRKKG
jgi:hypothetical protein